MANVGKSYGDNVVYRRVNLTLERGDRVALVGPNGAGKSTLLKILAGVLPIDNGERKLGYNVVSAYYAQHVLDLLDANNNPLRNCGGLRQPSRNRTFARRWGAFCSAETTS